MAEIVLKTWYLSAVPVFIFLKTARVGARRLRSAIAELDSVVETSADLRVVRDAINLNMRLAVLLAAEVAATFCGWALAALSGVGPETVAIHMLIFAAASVAGWLPNRRVEREFRALRVTSADPSVALTFGRWLKQWREVRLRLPD